MEELSDLRLEYGRLLNAAAERLRNAGNALLSSESQADGYPQLIERIRETVRNAVPPDATVLVVSKGDDELLNLYGRRALHFPQVEGGVYAGHHPADSAEAIAHLVALRAKGADYLVFPRPALWWLNHYAGLRQHLESEYSAIVRQKNTCVIYALGSSRKANPGGPGQPGGLGKSSEPGKASRPGDPGEAGQPSGLGKASVPGKASGSGDPGGASQPSGPGVELLLPGASAEGNGASPPSKMRRRRLLWRSRHGG
jgi:hypothetical protein